MQIVLIIHFVAQVKYNPYIDLRIDVVRPPNPTNHSRVHPTVRSGATKGAHTTPFRCCTLMCQRECAMATLLDTVGSRSRLSSLSRCSSSPCVAWYAPPPSTCSRGASAHAHETLTWHETRTHRLQWRMRS